MHIIHNSNKWIIYGYKNIIEALKRANINFMCSDISFYIDQYTLNKLTNRILTHNNLTTSVNTS